MKVYIVISTFQGSVEIEKVTKNQKTAEDSKLCYARRYCSEISREEFKKVWKPQEELEEGNFIWDEQNECYYQTRGDDVKAEIWIEEHEVE